MIDRMMRFYFSSIWMNLVWFLILGWLYTQQRGWQRWIFFAGGLFFVWIFTQEGGKRWGNPRQTKR